MSAPTITRDGELITVVMPNDDKRAARILAMREAGGVVANTGQPMVKRGRSFVFTYSVVTRTPKVGDYVVTKPAVAPAVRAAVGKRQARVTTGEDDRLAFLERELARVTALLAESAGLSSLEAMHATDATSAVSKSLAAKAKAKPAKPAKPAYVPTPEQARRASGGHSCDTCQDLHVVRGSGSRAGQPYRTAAGAAAATAPVPCPACQGRRARRSA